jgi:hypothetical protein
MLRKSVRLDDMSDSMINHVNLVNKTIVKLPLVVQVFYLSYNEEQHEHDNLV